MTDEKATGTDAGRPKISRYLPASEKIPGCGVGFGAVGAAGVVGVAKAGALAVIVPAALAPIAGISAGVMAVKKYTLNSKIKEQQYSCAVMKFYLDDLSKFLGL